MKKMIIALVVLALLVACFFLLRKHNEDTAAESSEAESAEDTVTISGLPDSAGIESFTVTNANGDFFFNKEGGNWILDSIGSDTDSDKVDEKLDDLYASVADQAMEGVTDFSQYGLDSPQITVTLKDSSGNETLVCVGDENAVTSQYYVRIGDSSTVYATGSKIYTAFNFTEEDVTAAPEETAASSETATE